MPIGILVMVWDERTGVDVLAQYPQELVIQEKTLMQIYSTHEFTGEPGMIALQAGAINLASYYAGKEKSVYIVLALPADEDGETYEEGLVECSHQILMSTDKTKLNQILPGIFHRLSVYPTLTEEQAGALLLQNDVKRSIMNRLREESVVSKGELIIWLRDYYKDSFVDIESVLTSMIKANVVKSASVKGLSSDAVFLTRDVIMLRIPPINLVKDPVGHHLPESLKDSYIDEVKKFFASYRPFEPDSLGVVSNILINPANYEVLKLLREAIVTRNDLEKLKKKGVEDVDECLKAFWAQRMIAVFKDEKNTEYHCLVSDFVVDKIFPRYNLNTIRQNYNSNAQNPAALLKAVDLMKEEFIIMQNTKKIAEKSKQNATEIKN